MTTIEFCEKSVKRAGYDSSAYDRGALGNVKAVLGDNPLLWHLPVSGPSGDGLSFFNFEDTPLRLSKDMEAGTAPRRRPTEQAVHKSRRRAGAAGTGECAASDVSCQDSESGAEGSATAEERKS